LLAAAAIFYKIIFAVIMETGIYVQISVYQLGAIEAVP
jgi:hypothetical protein